MLSPISTQTPTSIRTFTTVHPVGSPMSRTCSHDASWVPSWVQGCPARTVVVPTADMARAGTVTTAAYPPGVGWTPVAGQARATPRSVSFCNDMSLGSPTARPASVSWLRSYPPGFGFTPKAKAESGPASPAFFGLPSDKGCVTRTMSKESASSVTSIHCKSLKSENEGVLPREWLLMLRDSLGPQDMTAEEAGFMLPAPGWIRTQDAKAQAANPQPSPLPSSVVTQPARKAAAAVNAKGTNLWAAPPVAPKATPGWWQECARPVVVVSSGRVQPTVRQTHPVPKQKVRQGTASWPCPTPQWGHALQQGHTQGYTYRYA